MAAYTQALRGCAYARIRRRPRCAVSRLVAAWSPRISLRIRRPLLIGHALWRDRFGSDPGAIGRVFRAEIGVPGPDAGDVPDCRGPAARLLLRSRSHAASTPLVRTARTPRPTWCGCATGGPPAAAERHAHGAARRAATSPIPSDWSGVRRSPRAIAGSAACGRCCSGITVAASLVLAIVCANVAVLLLLPLDAASEGTGGQAGARR